MSCKFTLAIFDMDGVITDSEPIHNEVRDGLLLAHSLTGQVIARHDPTGKSTLEDYRYYTEHMPMDITAEELERTHYRQVLEGIRAKRPEPVEGFLKALDDLEAAGLKLAVASSSPAYYVNTVLELYGITRRFCAVAAGDMVPRVKPAPDVYELALRLAGVSPDKAFAVEDSRTGATAAKAAGLFALGYTAPAPYPQDLSNCDACAARMGDVWEVVRKA